MFSGAVSNGCAVGKIGVVLACGPSLDDLPNAFWDSLAAPQVVTVGINRVPAAYALASRGYMPDILFAHDMPVAPFNGNTRDLFQIWKLAAGNSWRIAALENQAAPLAPVDQWIVRSEAANGGADVSGKYRDGDIELEGVCIAESSADAALNLLWRMGVRKVVLAGVDSYGLGYCRWARELDPDQGAVACGRPEMVDFVESRWREIGASYRGELELWNCNPLSVACRVGTAQPGWGALK